MKIKILGTRGEIEETASHHSNKSGILIDNKILFDVGEKKFLKTNPKAIFITHLHPDHAFFIRKPKKEMTKIDIPIYSPDKYKKNHILVNKLSKRKKMNIYNITPIRTHHSLKVASQAYLIIKGGEKILYTGDLIWLDKKYHKKLKNLDLVITDGSYYRKGGLIRRDKISGEIYGHNGIPNLIRLFSKFTKNIMFVHFGAWFYKNIPSARKKLKILATQYQVNILIAYDGMLINTKTLV